MTGRLAARTLLRAPRRIVITLLGVAVPVALFAGTALFVDTSAAKMTAQALAPVQVDMQALLRSPQIAPDPIAARLAAQPGVVRAEPFASVDLPVVLPGGGPARTVRVFAVRPDYLRNHDWVRAETGGLGAGVLLTDALAAGNSPVGAQLQVQLPAGQPAVTLPVGGTVDLRKADTWFALLSGDNQGNVAYVPDAMVVDLATFDSRILPALRTTGSTPSAAGSGASDPGALTVQEHITLDRSAFAADPAVALTRSTGLRRTLERTAPGQLTVLDNVGDSLGAARNDATNAKVLFLFLGIPGVLVAGALAVAAAGSLAAAQRRELALLRLRGATDRQISRLAATQSLSVGVVGSALGLALAALGIRLLIGPAAFTGVSAGSVATSAVLAFVVGLTVTAVSLRTAGRAARRSTVAVQRAQLDPAGVPVWRRRKLDLVALAVGVVVLVVNVATGGFRNVPSEGQTLGLSFYLLLAPIALWVGFALLGLRGASWWLARATRPERARPLGSWPGASLRWLGRRPGRTTATAVIGVLAVAFGTNLLSFVHTYDVAKRTEAALSVGADLRITPASTMPPVVPPLSTPGIAASTPVRVVTLTVGTDKRTAYAIDPATFAATVPVGPVDAKGRTVDRRLLNGNPAAVLISTGFAKDFNVSVGDPVNVGLPDGRGGTRNVFLSAVGQYANATPAAPGADVVFGTDAFGLPTATDAAPQLGAQPPAAAGAAAGSAPAPDFYLARVAGGVSVSDVASRLQSAAGTSAAFTVLTFSDAIVKEQSTLATLNLRGLSRIETTGTLVIATLGIALLGAFLVLERRREYAVLRSLGATTRQVLVPPALEGAVTLAVSVVLGVPIGLAMTAITTRVLTPLFTVSPPLVQVPALPLGLLVAAVIATGAAALGVALVLVARLRTVAVLRES